MSYAIFITVHLFAAVIFIGVVFFEVLFLESIRKKIPSETMAQVQVGITTRARKIMPFVLGFLFLSGLLMANHHFPHFNGLMSSNFGQLLSVKMLLAFSVLMHFFTAMYLSRREKMSCSRFKFIHLSVFCHQVLIIFLAKNMFYINW
ncbi:MAG: hypothetical protein GY928_13945 [Colwellia sp.]|nr:hypothetical protein [Colwellia sp.]